MKEALKLALEALEATSPLGFGTASDKRHYGAITAIKEALAQPEQEPVAWVPYLSDRADGVKGRYAIARWNPRGYREVWNLRRHEWGAYSDDVLSLEEADTLLRLITIPTRKVTSPQPPQPKETEQEPVAKNKGGRITWLVDNWPQNCLLYTTPPQRKPLTDEELRVIENKINPTMRWRSSDEEGITLYPQEYYELVRAIEASHGIKGEA